ncbi:hypothetical protein KJ780_01940, partial [Candidatus Micrarchaeota archaeon]|nr:hypothetical protein [Candidatus Micrarchaeota archaeon]
LINEFLGSADLDIVAMAAVVSVNAFSLGFDVQITISTLLDMSNSDDENVSQIANAALSLMDIKSI